MYSINFTESRNKFCLSLHYNGGNSYLLDNGVEIHKFKAKESKTNAIPLCLRNISKDFSVDNMKKNGSNEYIYDFSVDYDAVAVDDILDIHKYLTKKHGVVSINKMLTLIKKKFFVAMTFSSCNSLKCVTMTNQEFKVRAEIININSNEPSFYLYSILVNKCSGS